MSGMAHFFVVVSGSKIHERVAHFFIDIYRCSLKMNIGLVFYSFGSIASSSGKIPRLLRRMPFT